MGRLRDAWHALRGYAAAQDSRTSSWAASGGSATAEVGAAAPTVARRARDAVRNDPYAARIVDLWTGNAVGAGITTRWPDIRNYVTSIDVRNAHATVATEVVIKDGATVIWRQLLPAAMAAPVEITFPTPLRGTAATAVNVACLTTGAQVYVNAQGYAAP